MRAIVCTDYGPPDVLQLRDVRKPVPKDNEVLVRIRATTVSAADCELRRFDFAPWIWLPIRLAFGIRRPRRRVLGQELAGDIESVGKDVRSLRTGDQVFAATGIGLGAYAEYICLRENPQTGAIATMPSNLSYEESAAVPYGGGEALQFLRKGNVRSGQRVLVNGAGGSFGTFAVQLAKVLGAHVTAVDSAPKLEMLRTIGADRVIDFSKEDFTDSPETYDVIFDVVRDTPIRSNGQVADRERMPTDGQSGLLADRSRQVGVEGEQEAGRVGSISGTSEDLAYLRGLVEAEELRPVIDRRFPLNRSSRLTGTPRPGTSWGTSWSSLRSAGRTINQTANGRRTECAASPRRPLVHVQLRLQIGVRVAQDLPEAEGDIFPLLDGGVVATRGLERRLFGLEIEVGLQHLGLLVDDVDP